MYLLFSHLNFAFYDYLSAAQSHGLDVMAGVLSNPRSVEIIPKQSRCTSSLPLKSKEKEKERADKAASKVSSLCAESSGSTDSLGADLNLILFDEVRPFDICMRVVCALLLKSMHSTRPT